MADVANIPIAIHLDHTVVNHGASVSCFYAELFLMLNQNVYAFIFFMLMLVVFVFILTPSGLDAESCKSMFDMFCDDDKSGPHRNRTQVIPLAQITLFSI